MSGHIEQPRFSCALGAQQSVVAIKRAVPILHSGPGCSNKISSLIGQGEAYAGGSTIPCTNSSEAEIVYGGEKKLRGVIDGAFQVIDADLYVVLTGCTSDIVGDDVASIASDYAGEGRPVVYAETGGFKSNNYVSHSVVVNAIIDQYVDKYKRDTEVIPGLVNVFASIPYQDPYWNGNLEELKRVLTGIGLTVNILFGQESGGVEEWKTIPDAQFNIFAGAWAGLDIVKHLEEKYGTPYLHFPYLPIGGLETSKFLRQVVEFGNLSAEPAEAFLKKEEERFYSHIERMADFIMEFRYGISRRFYAIADAGFVVGASKYLLNELGVIPAEQFITDDTPEEYQEEIREQLAHISGRRQAHVTFEADGGKIQDAIRSDTHDKRTLILGSAWDRDLAKEIGADLLIVTVPVYHRLVLSCGYAGYNGGLRLIEDIYDRVLDTYR